MVASWLDAPGLQIPLDITGSDSQAFSEDRAPFQLVRSHKGQPLLEVPGRDGGTASSGLN